ncbi:MULTISPECIES: aldehyde dehydrogenase family protein [Halobacterium]|uniref:Aldehyde dehydrogenase n=3 Tax=Halobacterium salinarum TaxID=2242 RepID=Q9HQZ2_HALSA|nr:aldehyde dehydrogenase family protein [Halobacterium salinarum]AAG19367.1 glyceraldehyde-3-phosphate dehydrogenase [Halobacterium salinarum NRC-1]MBB6090480.1 glyceraldehyde-3-phosphate dehydrogenase [NAD(P)+] [Halobacterium salinarum]MCF2206685.1 aldehyde dehydrogenase family protein [Halobacterium salinarum]MDL0130800.1 aldehyde dehydrogenase family protein [Halobacterium salinarum]MDL0141245.1 aldehyde dehydrogenase family protein [Halobacterium salinarum]
MEQNAIQRRERPFVAGEWVSDGEPLPVSDLADGGTFASVAAADTSDAERALSAATGVHADLRETTVPERVEWLESIADGIRRREDELAEVIVREAGKPISSARGEVQSAAERFDRAVGELRHLTGEYRTGTTAGHEDWQAIVKHEPMGTVLCITPYNYPLSTMALQVAPAIAAGNAVIVKPASKTPISGAILADIAADAGLPDGAYNFVPGESSVIGDPLASDARVDAIAMTGSSGAGEHVARQSGITRLHMELGGNAPAIVFEDADLDAAADAATAGSLKYAGQRCSAVSRVLAHESVHDELVSRIDDAMAEWSIGDLFDTDTTLGPLVSADQADWVAELVDDAVDRGATVVRGGERHVEDGVHYYEPTLLADVPRDARIVDEEQFGPVCAVTTVTDEDDAVRTANGSELALDAAVFTADHDRAMRVAERVNAGAVRINGAPSHGLGDVPFGGNDASGIGREGLDSTIHEFVREKSIIL